MKTLLAFNQRNRLAARPDNGRMHGHVRATQIGARLKAQRDTPEWFYWRERFG